MKTLLTTISIAFALVFSTGFAEAGWVETDTIGVSDEAAKEPVALIMNSGNGTGHPYDALSTPNVWHEIDLTGIVPEGTKWVFLSGTGLASIYHYDGGFVWLRTYFRPKGSTVDRYMHYWYVGGRGDNAFHSFRQPGSTFVRLSDDLKFEFKWEVEPNSIGSPPNYPSFGVNYSLQAYGR